MGCRVPDNSGDGPRTAGAAGPLERADALQRRFEPIGGFHAFLLSSLIQREVLRSVIQQPIRALNQQPVVQRPVVVLYRPARLLIGSASLRLLLRSELRLVGSAELRFLLAFVPALFLDLTALFVGLSALLRLFASGLPDAFGIFLLFIGSDDRDTWSGSLE